MEEVLLRIYISSLGHCMLIHESETLLCKKCVCTYNLKETFVFLQVSLASNFSACRVYWNPAATTEKESYVESVLQKSAPRIRYCYGINRPLHIFIAMYHSMCHFLSIPNNLYLTC